MKIALVHDYIKEFGGAERVLRALTEIFPDAPIYTAFRVKGSTADKEFSGKKIIESWLAPVLKIGNLYSPLRFLIPVIWGSFDLSRYDLVITSSSWYITRGFKIGSKTIVIDYCHTPPRWLYGFETSVGFTKYWPVRLYAKVVGNFIKKCDYKTAQKVNYFIANSKNVAARIKKYYGRDSTVIYPPVDVSKIVESTKNTKKEDYFLIVSRLVGAKGIEAAINLSEVIGFKLKIVGESSGYSRIEKEYKKRIEFLGRLSDEKLFKEYAKVKALITLARDEDFGMTVVEAQAAGTPVIAFNGGGFKESVVDGVTGIFINEISEKSLSGAIEKIEKTNWDREKLVANAKKFSKERFKKEVLEFINKKCRNCQK
jgi:glycosyltransferase involved in cell wall biosynthesis